MHSSEVGKGVHCPAVLIQSWLGRPWGLLGCSPLQQYLTSWIFSIWRIDLTKQFFVFPHIFLILIPTVITPTDCPGPQGFPACVCKQHLRPYFVPWVVLDHAFSSGQYLLHFALFSPGLPSPLLSDITSREGRVVKFEIGAQGGHFIVIVFYLISLSWTAQRCVYVYVSMMIYPFYPGIHFERYQP